MIRKLASEADESLDLMGEPDSRRAVVKKAVKVFNLATGAEQEFTCSPAEAVVAAYEQAKG